MSGEPIGLMQESVFLLNSVPRFLSSSRLKDIKSVLSEVGVAWHQLLVSEVLPSISITEHEHIVALFEGIWEERYRLQNNL